MALSSEDRVKALVCISLLCKASALIKGYSLNLELNVLRESGPFVQEAIAHARDAFRLHAGVSKILDVLDHWYDRSAPSQVIEEIVADLSELSADLMQNIVIPLEQVQIGNIGEEPAKKVYKDIQKEFQRIKRKATGVYEKANDELTRSLGDVGASYVSDIGETADDEVADPLETGPKTVVCIDLFQYGRLSFILEDILDSRVVFKLNEEIEGFVRDCLSEVDPRPEDIVNEPRGDGAIMIFPDAERALDFAEFLQQQSHLKNQAVAVPAHRKFYRIGVSSGKLSLLKIRNRSGRIIRYRFAGTVVGRAVRLETGANTGAIMICEDTWGMISAERRERYTSLKQVPAKRHEKDIAAREWQIVPGSETETGAG